MSAGCRTKTMSSDTNIFHIIKTQVPILDVVQECTTLKRIGLYWKAPCPFHHEKTASFTVSPHREIFYCFGCQAGGDVIVFIQKMENCTALEAVHYLAERYRITLPKEVTYERSTNDHSRKERHRQLCELLAKWFASQLQTNTPAYQYLEARGFTRTSIQEFMIGYFPQGYAEQQKLLKYLRNHQFLVDDILAIKMCMPSKNGVYSPFEGRIIFPIKDGLGHFCGFGGRIYLPHDERSKYYNSAENEYFSKGSMLYGLDAAKKEMQKTGKAFLVEGYIDAIMMAQAGIKNTIATLGTACTINHLKMIARYAQELYVVYDGDAAGKQAVLKLAQICWQVDLEPKVIVLPPGHDPASLLMQGNDFTAYIDNAKNIFVFFLATIGEGFHHKHIADKLKLIESFLEIIRVIECPLKQDLLMQRASKELDIPFGSLKDAMKRSKGSFKDGASSIQPRAVQPEEDDEPILDDEYVSLEKRIVCAILNNGELLTKEHQDYLATYLSPVLASMVQQVIVYIENHGTMNFTHFFTIVDEEIQHYISKLLLESNEIQVTPEYFTKLILQLKRKQWKVIARDIKGKIKNAEKNGDTKLVGTIMQDFLLLKREIFQ